MTAEWSGIGHVSSRLLVQCPTYCTTTLHHLLFTATNYYFCFTAQYRLHPKCIHKLKSTFRNYYSQKLYTSLLILRCAFSTLSVNYATQMAYSPWKCAPIILKTKLCWSLGMSSSWESRQVQLYTLLHLHQLPFLCTHLNNRWPPAYRCNKMSTQPKPKVKYVYSKKHTKTDTHTYKHVYQFPALGGCSLILYLDLIWICHP